MFLRNIGVSYDLAILDTHVLRFLEIQNLLNLRPAVITNIRALRNELNRLLRIMQNRLVILTGVWILGNLGYYAGRKGVGLMSIVTLVSGGLDSTVMAVLAKGRRAYPISLIH